MRVQVSSDTLKDSIKIVSYVGNMSNPSLNRWGSNIYWSVLWYSDTFYSKNLQQDLIFDKLLNIYLIYGIQTTNNIFYKKYWFYSNTAIVLNEHRLLNNNYYRWFTKIDPISKENFSYSLRKTTIDIYRMKFWLLKFANWVVINVYWFQPIKKAISYTQKTKKKQYDYFNSPITKTSINTQRFKVLTSKTFFKLSERKLYYKF